MTRVPGDPVPFVKAALVALLADEPVVPEFATHKWPKGWSLDSGKPLVLIADDSGPMLWPVWSEHDIRVTVAWDDVPTIRRIARRCIGHILDNLPEGLASRRTEGVTLTEAQHTATGADLSSGIVTVIVRTEDIA